MKREAYRMKLFLLPTLIFVLVFKSQYTYADDTAAVIHPLKFTIGAGVSVGNFMETNASPGPDKNSFSGTGSLDLGLNYKKDGARFEMTNELHWLVEIQKSGLHDSSRIQRVTDDLKTLHDFSVGMFSDNKLSVNLIVKTTTSIFTIYNGDYFVDYNHLGKEKAFLNPYEVILSPGFKLSPDHYVRISISPFSMRLYGLTNQNIANTGLYTHDSDTNGDYSLFVYARLGAELNIWYDREINKWLSIQYRVSASSDYFENLGKTGLLDGLFITKIQLLNGLYLMHNASLKGDFAVSPFRPYYAQTITLCYTKTF